MSADEIIKIGKMSYRRLLGYIKPYKNRFFWGVFFSILFGLSNGLILFILNVIVNLTLPGNTNFEMPAFLEKFGISKDIIEGGSNKGSIKFVIMAGLTIPIMVLFRGLLQYLSKYCMIWVGARVLYDIRNEIFQSLLNQSQEFYNKTKTGNLIQTVFNQSRMAATAAMTLIGDVVRQPVSILSIVAFLFWKDWIFASCALFIFPLCLLPVIHISKKVRKSGGAEEQQAGELMVTMHETFSGIRVVKAHAREDYELERFSNSNLGMMQFIVKWQKAMEIVGPLMESVASIGIGAGLVYAWLTDIKAQDFFFLYLSLVAIYPHAKALSRLQILMQKCLVATTSVFELMDRKPDIQDKKNSIKLENTRGQIEFKNVTFSYKVNKHTPAVRNVSFKFEAGKKYALVGSTGAGKTTLFSLLLRFYDVTTGQILIDGHNIRDITQQSLRDNIGLVNQDIFLFHDTIYNNIKYGNLKASEDEIKHAARHAYAEEFILDEKTGGYDAIIGDAGAKLSGGQKQRITIARAILRNAPILLLDEATSAVDSETEMKIQTAIDELSQGKTTIAIAHRLSTVLNADKLLYMENGEIGRAHV